MRKLFIVGVFAAFAAGVVGTAFANYFYPGRIIIGTGIISGGTTTSSVGGPAIKAMGGEPCVVAPPIECECFKGMPVLQACIEQDVNLGCLMPHTQYDVLKQDGPVVSEDGSHTLGGLVCTGKADGTVLVNLP